MKGSSSERRRSSQSGAALVTTILITFLLGTACIALLTAVGASSRNGTDALSESKAYYAAESGIQATINVLRNTPSMNYSKAVDLTVSNAAGDPSTSARLSAYLNYALTSDAASRVVLDSSASSYQAYAVTIHDPDDTKVQTVYTTSMAQVSGGSGATLSTVSLTGQTNAAAVFNGAASVCVEVGTLNFVNGGYSSNTTVPFALNIHTALPPPSGATRAVYGNVKFNGGPVTVTPAASTNTYALAGSDIKLYTASGCPDANPFDKTHPATVTAGTGVKLFAKMTPLEPYRLQLLSTGYGSNGSVKQLEVVVQRNFFNDISPGAAVSLIGPNADMQGGNSKNFIINGGSVASVSVSDSTGLANVMDDPRAANYQPPPVVADSTALPAWQQSPQALDALVSQLRQTAQNSGRYFTPQQPPTSWGNSNGTGITFCEGDCSLTAPKQTPGGGILVVTGTLSVNGNTGFNGLIIITGPNGLQIGGGGQGTWNGSIVIAPYNRSTMQWQTPHYDDVKGGSIETDFDTLLIDNSLDAVSGVSDFVLGVAEK